MKPAVIGWDYPEFGCRTGTTARQRQKQKRNAGVLRFAQNDKLKTTAKTKADPLRG